jgi:hypothetical protein
MSAVGVRAGRAVAAAAAAVLLLTACGGDDERAAAPGTTAPATTSAASPSDDGTPAPGTGNGGTDQPPPGDEVPPPGTPIIGENISADHAADLQAEVDEGHEPWRLDQGSVATTFAAHRFGWTDVEIALDDPHTVQVTDVESRHLVSLQMRQPVREGEDGIWVVDSGVWLG